VSSKKVSEKVKKKSTSQKDSGEEKTAGSKKKGGVEEDRGEKGQTKTSKKQLAKEKSAERKKTNNLKSNLLQKYPKRFTTNIPVTAKDGALVTDGKFEAPTFEERYGDYTGYHITSRT